MNRIRSVSVLFIFVSFSAHAMGSGTDLPRYREVVSGKIYRGGLPTEAGIQELAKLRMRTILNIRDEDPIGIKKEGQIVRKMGMTFISIPLSGLFSPSDKKIDEIENILSNPIYHPLFVHCTRGQDRTGLVVGLYRVFHQNVAPKDAYREMLDLGFRPALIGLRHYFEKRTGYDTDDVRLSEESQTQLGLD